MGYGGFNPCEKGSCMCTRSCAARLAPRGRTASHRGGTLPVLLHPSDGFVLVELSLEFVLLQGQHRHARGGWGGRVPFALLGQDDSRLRGGGCLFSRFPRRFELASLGSLSDPVGCARTARQWRNLHPLPAAPTPSSSDGWNLGPNAGRVTATVLYHLVSTEVIKQEVRKCEFNLFTCSFNVCDVIVPISCLKGIMGYGQGEDKHHGRPLLGDFSMTSSSPSPNKGRLNKPLIKITVNMSSYMIDHLM